MALNIVTNYKIIGEMKKSRHFMMSLGFVATIENNGARTFNDKDKFSFFYNSQYKTTIYAQGSVGDIRFYTDHYINNDVLAVYTGDTFEEFIFDFDPAVVREKGIDFYLGHILKETDLKHQERVEQNELRKMEEKPKGDAGKIINNPGSVTYEDLKAYLDEQRKSRQL
jgi:hypothetical protein